MNTLKVLIVEDEAIIALDIKMTILNLDYLVTDIVNNSVDALNSINKNEPDIILMDINIEGDKDGIDTVQGIYTIKYIPVIYLTSCDDNETIIRAIKTDPVGYIIKPFTRAELNATLLLGIYKSKKNAERLTHPIEFKNLGLGYYFNDKNYNLYYKNSIVKIGTKEKKLLNLLIQANGKDVSFENIENEVWDGNSVSNDSIRNTVARLRNKMDYKFIQSVPYFGFRLSIIKEEVN